MIFRVQIFVLLIMASMHTPAHALQLAHGNGVDISIWRIIISFLFCIALAAGAILALRRKLPIKTLFKRMDVGRLKLVDQISLGQLRGIYLIELDGKEYLALFSQQGCSLTPANEPLPKKSKAS